MKTTHKNRSAVRNCIRGRLLAAFAGLLALANVHVSAAPPKLYFQNFDGQTSAPPGWVLPGGWTVGNGQINAPNSQGRVKALYTDNGAALYGTNYVLRASVKNQYNNYGNLLGVVYNSDATGQNYYEVLVSPWDNVAPSTTVLRQGWASVYRIQNGVPTAVVTNVPYQGARNGVWVDIEVSRTSASNDPQAADSRTLVRVNGKIIFDGVQNELGAGFAGVETLNTMGYFDNFSLAPQPVIKAYEEQFSSGPIQWTVLNDTASSWTVSGGTYNRGATPAPGSQGLAVYDGNGVQPFVRQSDYTYSASVWLEGSSANNRAGIVYNFNNANHYSEVLINSTGEVQIREVSGGTNYQPTVVQTNNASPAYYGAATHTWHEITVIRKGTKTTVNVNGRRVFTDIDQPNLLNGKFGVVVDSGRASFDDFVVYEGEYKYKRTFPKIAGVFVGGDFQGKSYAQDIAAKHDFAILQTQLNYVSPPPESATPQMVVQQIKSRNPAILLANYTIVMDQRDGITDPNERDYYRQYKLDHEVGPNPQLNPPNNLWWAYNAANQKLTYTSSDQTKLTNLTYWVTPDADGFRYPQWHAFTSAALFDGISAIGSGGPNYDLWYTDEVYYKLRHVADWNRDGINESSDPSVAPEALYNWRLGTASFAQKQRQMRPDILSMANPDGNPETAEGYLRPQVSPDPYQAVYSAALVESGFGMGFSRDTAPGGWGNVMEAYRAELANTAEPHLAILGARGTRPDETTKPRGVRFATDPVYGTDSRSKYANGDPFSFFRCTFASALLEDGYYAYSMGENYVDPVSGILRGPYALTSYCWFDEFNVLLGHPTQGPVRTANTDGTYRRTFQNGLVIVNPPTNTGDVTITLSSGAYKRFSGTQDATTNNGQIVTASFTLKRGDGIVLLKNQ